MSKPAPQPYQCLRCGHAWVQRPLMVVNVNGDLIGFTVAADCPACQHPYVRHTETDKSKSLTF